ncbi:MAG: histidine kinase dimerization/phospho-acceptor domain-containing protein, partial [Spirochaetales bacterium]|nr:histidine kinase dimerization/phospho-acceptor domain-containing protein [Spirochaetales bacterium]
MISSFGIAWVSWSAQMENSDGLESPRYLHSTLLEILTGDYDEKTIASKGILFISNEKGDALYVHPDVLRNYPQLMEKNLHDPEQELFTLIVDDMPKMPFGMSIYRYKGQAGIVIFVQELVSKHASAVKRSFVLIWIFYLGFILFPLIVMGIFMHPMARSVLILEEAALAIGRGNWDVKLMPDSETKCKHKPKSFGPMAHLMKSFDQMRLELKENHERQQRIMMAISHDLKTPLTSIKGYLEALQDGMAQDPEELNRYTSIIMDKTYLLEERIND